MEQKQDDYSGKASGSDSNMSGRGGQSAAGTATARSFYDQAKETAGEAYDAVSEKAVSKLTDQKDTLSGSLMSIAESIRQAGANLETSGSDGITAVAGKYSSSAARSLEQAADYFERKSLREMTRDLEGFARRNSAVFIGGAFAAGLLTARFLKSPGPEHLEQAAGRQFNTAAVGAGDNVADLESDISDRKPIASMDRSE